MGATQAGGARHPIIATTTPAITTSTNTHAQALMRTGLPAALCRLVVSPGTPPEQRLQAMAMLRVLVHDPGTHELMVEAKAIHALVAKVQLPVSASG